MEEKNDPRADALALLKRSSLGTLAYVSEDGAPHASVVYYAPTDTFSLYFMTVSSSRKYVALKKNPLVAFTIASYQKPQTLQIEGEVVEIDDLEEYERETAALAEVLASNSTFPAPLTKFGSGTKLLRIKPVWVRWGDFAAGQGTVFNEILP